MEGEGVLLPPNPIVILGKNRGLKSKDSLRHIRTMLLGDYLYKFKISETWHWFEKQRESIDRFGCDCWTRIRQQSDPTHLLLSPSPLLPWWLPSIRQSDRAREWERERGDCKFISLLIVSLITGLSLSLSLLSLSIRIIHCLYC